jgi:hypothetical protein
MPKTTILEALTSAVQEDYLVARVKIVLNILPMREAFFQEIQAIDQFFRERDWQPHRMLISYVQ